MGSMSKDDSFKLLNAYYDAGGNFIDTANNYQNEQSETWIGEWMKERKNRDHVVLATKYTTSYRAWEEGPGLPANFSGNHAKSLHMSVRDSLRKLQTDYIDILYLHWWDWTCGIEQVMDSLHTLVQQRKVLYLGVSDTPAWIVAACNTYARDNGKSPFVIYQGKWSVAERDFERDIIPMCRHFGLALAPWGALGAGKFQTKKAIEERKKKGESLRSLSGGDQTGNEEKTSAALEKVAKEHGIESLTAIALAYVMQKTPNVFPIIGGRKVEHLMDNIQALKIHLTDEQIEELEGVVPFDLGFPTNMIGDDPKEGKGPAFLVNMTAKIAFNRNQKAIGHD